MVNVTGISYALGVGTELNFVSSHFLRMRDESFGNSFLNLDILNS